MASDSADVASSGRSIQVCGPERKIETIIYKSEETKRNASAHLVLSRSKIGEGSPRGTRNTMEERICETEEF